MMGGMRAPALALAWTLAWAHLAQPVEFEVYQAQQRPLAVALVLRAPSSDDAAHIRAIVERDWRMSTAIRSLDPLLFIADPDETWRQIVYADWRVIGAEGVVLAEVSRAQARWKARISVHDPFQMRRLASKEAVANSLYALAHRIADVAFEALVGVRGHFSSRLYYVRKTRRGSVLVRANADASDPQVLAGPFEMLLAPDVTPDGSRLVFNRIMHGRSEIVLQERGRLVRVSAFPGLNATPALSPDGTRLAATLSLHDNEDLYLYTFATKRWRRLTRSPAIDISPVWSPDGTRLAFVSNREGSPQIYILELATGRITRLTWEGRYNTAPAWSPTGERIAYVAMKNFQYALATIRPDGTDVRYLAVAERIESPCWSPNGWMIAFTVQQGKRRSLAVVPARGGDWETITPPREDASDCAWAWR